MNRLRRIRWLRCALLANVIGLLTASDLPLGHADFLPSKERPIGLLGDGTGRFPGAEPPTSWDYRTGANVKWSLQLPTGGQGSPIVVGNRLFITSDPHWLHCVDAESGRLLWSDRVTPLDLLPPAHAALAEHEWRELLAFRGGIHAVMYEFYQLRYRIARIEAVRSGTPFSWKNARGLFNHSTNVSGSPGLNGHLTHDEETQVDAWAGQVDDARLASMRERLAELDRLIAEEKYHSGNGYVQSHMPFSRGVGEKAFLGTPTGKRWSKRWATINRLGLVPDVWQEWLGPGWPTPASDGEHLYVTFGTGQVACYTLDGEQRWLRQFQLLDPSIRGQRAFDDRHCASPILTDEGVVVMHGHYADKSLGGVYRWMDIRCLDKRTGAVRWQHRFDDRGGHDVPLHTRLRHAGMDLIVTNYGPVYRSSDGELVTNLQMYCCALPTLLPDGAVLLQDANPGGGRTHPVAVARFRPDSSHPSGVATDIIWRHQDVHKLGGMMKTRTTHSPFFDGSIFHAGEQADPFTGKRQLSWKHPRSGGVASNPIIAGGKLITVSLRGLCAVTDLATEQPTVLGTGLIGSSRMRRFLMDVRHGPADVRAEMDQGILLMHYHRLATANPWAQGKRLYLRSMDDLFCIEDAGVRVDPVKDRRP